MLAGGGDELQGIKRGIMEMADLIVINKADGDNLKKVDLARKEYENALHLFPALPNGWFPKVLTASAVQNIGFEKIWENIEEFVHQTKFNQFFFNNRQEQALFILKDAILQYLSSNFFENPIIQPLFKQFEKQILQKQISPYEAAKQLLEKYFEEIRK
jgi:LAO/AO transport system kinase